jgi:hypothetical protein
MQLGEAADGETGHVGMNNHSKQWPIVFRTNRAFLVRLCEGVVDEVDVPLP